MNSLQDVKQYIFQRQPSGLIIDTSVLIFLIVGIYDQDYIERCSLLNNNDKSYSKDDFKILQQILALFQKRIVITPQVTAELYSLSKNSIDKGRLQSYIEKVIEFLKTAKEKHQSLHSILDKDSRIICDFGFTDITMSELANSTRMPILTDDMKLYHYLVSQKTPTISFNYIKNQELQSVLTSF